MMRGITGYGVYLPFYRLNRKTVFQAMAWFNPALAGLARGEKAVANHDEDSLTLAVGAGLDCLRYADRQRVGALYLASTTLPNRERGNASIARTALNLGSGVRTAEFSGCLKAGTSALISALQEPESASTLVCASDCRLGKAGGTLEQLCGDGAAAVAVGTEGVVATLLGHRSVSYDFADTRRMGQDKYTRSWEERWIREAGYGKLIPEALNGLLAEGGIKLQDVQKVIFPPLGGRDHEALARRLRLAPEQVQSPLMESVGNTGAAHPLLMLAAALEEAGPGDRILMASYGSGSDALLFQVTDAIKGAQAAGKLRRALGYRSELDSYTKYLSFKGMLDKEIGIRGEEKAPTSLSLAWREQNTVLGLVGGRCLKCGIDQFPRDKVCVNPDCGAVDQMEDCAFAGKKGLLFTFTADHLAFSEDPPALYGIVDFEGGGRYWFDITDSRQDALRVGQAVQMTFRRKYQDEARSVSGYFWKAMPFRGK